MRDFRWTGFRSWYVHIKIRSPGSELWGGYHTELVAWTLFLDQVGSFLCIKNNSCFRNGAQIDNRWLLMGKRGSFKHSLNGYYPLDSLDSDLHASTTFWRVPSLVLAQAAAQGLNPSSLDWFDWMQRKDVPPLIDLRQRVLLGARFVNQLAFGFWPCCLITFDRVRCRWCQVWGILTCS